MKTKHWMFAVLSTCLLAETILAQAPPAAPQETAPPVIPAGEAPKPEPKKKKPAAEKKTPAKTAKKAAEPEKPAATISAGPAVAKEKNVNVRGQAAINSEIVTHLKRGDLVTVLDEVTLKKAKTDEPAKWAKIALPVGSVVWVNTAFIKPDTKDVIPKRLNIRSGPGENYSVLGRIERGTVVKEVETKGEWMKIEAPTNSYGFVAAHLLSTDPADLGPALAKANPPAPPVLPPPPPVETAAVVTPPPPPPAEPIPTPPPVVTPPPPPPAQIAVTPPPPEEPPVEEPPIKRIVTREGIVKGSASIQAPSYFVLRSLDNNKTINYLYSPNTNVVMKEYHLQRVLVTGEEILDERWPNTPVINIDTIQTVP
jgi:SH3-like domain-containing protein